MSELTSEERLAAIADRASAMVRELAGEFDITFDEWLAALEYLTRVGKHDEFILLSDVNLLSTAIERRSHDQAEDVTESNVLGPYWRDGAPPMESPAQICRDDEPGDILLLSGFVRADGEPVPGAVLDVWQTAAGGLYENEDPDQPDMNLRGRVRVADDGFYSIRTVRPVPYQIPTDGPVGEFLRALDRHAWRPAHLHFRVEAEGYEPITTMLFIEGDQWLHDDAIGAVKDSLVISLEPSEDDAGNPLLRASFDFSLRPVAPPSSQ